MKGIERDGLIEGLRAHGHRDVMALEGPDALPTLIGDIATDGDMVICLGAGNITTWANDLPNALEAHTGNSDPQREAGA